MEDYKVTTTQKINSIDEGTEITFKSGSGYSYSSNAAEKENGSSDGNYNILIGTDSASFSQKTTVSDSADSLSLTYKRSGKTYTWTDKPKESDENYEYYQEAMSLIALLDDNAKTKTTWKRVLNYKDYEKDNIKYKGKVTVWRDTVSDEEENWMKVNVDNDFKITTSDNNDSYISASVQSKKSSSEVKSITSSNLNEDKSYIKIKFASDNDYTQCAPKNIYDKINN